MLVPQVICEAAQKVLSFDGLLFNDLNGLNYLNVLNRL